MGRPHVSGIGAAGRSSRSRQVGRWCHRRGPPRGRPPARPGRGHPRAVPSIGSPGLGVRAPAPQPAPGARLLDVETAATVALTPRVTLLLPNRNNAPVLELVLDRLA